jgi:hypothetical protein
LRKQAPLVRQAQKNAAARREALFFKFGASGLIKKKHYGKLFLPVKGKYTPVGGVIMILMFKLRRNVIISESFQGDNAIGIFSVSWDKRG